MPTPLSSHFESVRLSLGLKPGQVAKLAGADPSIGGSRLKEFERDGIASDRDITRWAAALGIPAETVSALESDARKRARAEWEAWAAVPIEPILTIKPIPAIWIRRPIPAELTTHEQIDDWVRNRCEYRPVLRCVQWSRTRATFYRPNGTSWENIDTFGEGGPGPSMRLT
jgi:hypothetical protein